MYTSKIQKLKIIIFAHNLIADFDFNYLVNHL